MQAGTTTLRKAWSETMLQESELDEAHWRKLPSCSPTPVSNRLLADSANNEVEKNSKLAMQTNDLENNPTTVATARLEALEDFLPLECHADLIELHDEAGAFTAYTGRLPHGQREKPTTYKRVLPEPEVEVQISTSSQLKRVALRVLEKLGEGGHSAVFRAALSLPPPYRTTSQAREVTIAVKVASADKDDRRQLAREADAYELMSHPSLCYLQNDWPGYVVCDGGYGYAYQQMKNGKYPTISTLKAAVPKFFGYYHQIDERGSTIAASPILLLEDCGRSVRSFKRSVDYQAMDLIQELCVKLALYTQVPTMYASLAQIGILQGSVKFDNVTIQPGPLHWPPAERSYTHPSLRIIDFGRVCLHRYRGQELLGKPRCEVLDTDHFWLSAKDAMKSVLKLVAPAKYDISHQTAAVKTELRKREKMVSVRDKERQQKLNQSQRSPERTTNDSEDNGSISNMQHMNQSEFDLLAEHPRCKRGLKRKISWEVA